MTLMLKVFQTFHKPYPRPGPGCDWIQGMGVGGYHEDGLMSDATGEHISALNPYYCELTAMYWAWKNDHSPYVGFYHYRRYLNFAVDSTWRDAFAFSMPLEQSTIDYFALPQQRELAMRMLEMCDVIIPRRFAQEASVEAQWLKYHPVEPWEHYKLLVAERFPMGRRYLDLYQLSNLSTTCNMFVMPRSIFERYCEDLFAIVDPIWKHWGARWGPYMDRYPGFLAERFLGFWLHMKGLRVLEVPLLLLEPPQAASEDALSKL